MDALTRRSLSTAYNELLADSVCCVCSVLNCVVYVLNLMLFCVDINECRDRTTCPENSTCVNLVPGHLCNCTNKGFSWNNVTNKCEGEC